MLFGLEQETFRSVPAWDVKYMPSYSRYYEGYAYPQPYVAEKLAHSAGEHKGAKEEGKVSHIEVSAN